MLGQLLPTHKDRVEISMRSFRSLRSCIVMLKALKQVSCIQKDLSSPPDRDSVREDPEALLSLCLQHPRKALCISPRLFPHLVALRIVIVSRSLLLPQVAQDLALEALQHSVLARHGNGDLPDLRHDTSRELESKGSAYQL